MAMLGNDAHKRTAALVFGRSLSTVTSQERHIGKVLNVMAANGQLNRTKQVAELASITETNAMKLVELFRQRVLGVTMGVD